VQSALKEEIIDVVNPIAQGSAKTSMYVLIPKKLLDKVSTSDKVSITESTEFVVILAENGDIIYRRKEI
jgi:hypothetical protein